MGTFFLVFAGVGTAVFGLRQTDSGGITDPAPAQVGVGNLGIALAVGLAFVAMAYAVGSVSGGHFNPAVTLGLWAARRFDDLREVALYIAAQVVGGALAGAVVWGMARSILGSAQATGQLDANGFGEHSPSAQVSGRCCSPRSC